MNELITIGIPVYNAENYIEKSLFSALNQTYKTIEYLIVDDKGTDNSIDIIKNIASTHPRGKAIKIIVHPENLGIGEGRNTIIKFASGKYLFFMDNDDELSIDCIQKLYDEMIRADVDIVCGSYNDINKTVITHSPPDRFVEKDKIQIFLSYFNGRFHCFTWNKLFKISFLRENKILCRHRIIDDHYFTLQVLLYANSYSVIPDITYFHYQTATSASGGEWKENIYKEWVQVFEDEKKLFQKTSFSLAVKRKIKKDFFMLRFVIADITLRSHYPVQHYIRDYLNPNFLKGKDVFKDPVLFSFYLFSIMPLWVKKIGIPLLIQIKITLKKIKH